jgi:DNA-binding NtrC family response regulator
MKKSDARILVVDDDRHLLNLLTETLGSIGYSTEDARSAKEALEKLSESKFHLIVSDIKMPEMDGLKLLSQIRKSYPGLPVIFITGVPRQDITGAANTEGILTKPFRISNLEYMIEQALDAKPPQNSDEDSGELLGESLEAAD